MNEVVPCENKYAKRCVNYGHMKPFLKRYLKDEAKIRSLDKRHLRALEAGLESGDSRFKVTSCEWDLSNLSSRVHGGSCLSFANLNQGKEYVREKKIITDGIDWLGIKYEWERPIKRKSSKAKTVSDCGPELLTAHSYHYHEQMTYSPYSPTSVINLACQLLTTSLRNQHPPRGHAISFVFHLKLLQGSCPWLSTTTVHCMHACRERRTRNVRSESFKSLLSWPTPHILDNISLSVLLSQMQRIPRLYHLAMHGSNNKSACTPQLSYSTPMGSERSSVCIGWA